MVPPSGARDAGGARPLGVHRWRADIHWPDLDEDISVEMLLAGRKSGESRRSFKQWLEAKQAGRGLTLYELTAHERE